MSRLLALLLVLTSLVLPGAAASAPVVSASAVVSTALPITAAAPRAQAPQRQFRPRRGVTFNSPVDGPAVQRAIFAKIMRSIDATPRGEQINIFSWNFQSPAAADALLRAQKRGVRVRLLMDEINNTEIVNGPFRKVRFGLAQGNEGKRKARRSWARTCEKSCRGTRAQAHAKFFMFSRVGPVPRVVIQGSANLTEAATFNQWNDVYTHVRNEDVWAFYEEIFRQSATDKPIARPFEAVRAATFRLIQFPLVGGRDPVLQLLDEVNCQGASNTASGVTRIRIAPDVFRNARGMRIAKVVKNLWNRGCDIRIGYTVIGIDVGRYLRSPEGRGPVPLRHLVQDLDGDGEFDNYFHLKAMSIVGHLGDNREGYAVLNGSANWSGTALQNDENVGVYRNKRDTLAYDGHIDFWYERFGNGSMRSTSSGLARGTVPTIGPDALVFGSGPGAVYEDGTPYSVTGVDPYANVVD